MMGVVLPRSPAAISIFVARAAVGLLACSAACAPAPIVLTPEPPPPPTCPAGGCGAQHSWAAGILGAKSRCLGGADTQCAGASPDECARQALQAWSEATDARAIACIAQALTEACELGDARACGFAGRLWIDGRGVPHDSERGVAMLVKACDEGEGLACLVAAAWLADTDHVRQARVEPALRARLIAEHGCIDGESTECFRAAVAFEGGDKQSPRDAVGAVRAYGRGCDLGNSLACNALGVALDYGDGIARDPERSAASFDRACRLGDSLGCANLGYMFENAEGVARDVARARALYRDACTSGNVYGCLHDEMLAAQDAGAPRDRMRVFTYWRRACESRDARACAFVGVMYEDGPDGLARDESKSQEAMKRSCDLGNRRACAWMKLRRGE
jgi:TPR repeat protein